MATLSAKAQQMVDQARAAKKATASSDGTLDGLFKAAAEQKTFPRYTAADMVELMVQHPEYTHAQFSAHFGYKPSWFAGVLVSPNLQAELDKRRHEVINPNLTGTMDDMFRALLIRSLSVLQVKMEDADVLDDTVIKAAALGVKALGMGTEKQGAEEVKGVAGLVNIAEKLAAAMAGRAPALSHAHTPAPRDYTIEAALQEIPR